MVSPELLRRYPFFANFTDQELKGLAMLAEEQRYAAGDSIFSEGEAARKSYLIVEGSVDIVMIIDGFNHVGVASLGAGEWLAWSALIPPYTLSATGHAAAPATLVAFDGPALLAMCEVDPHFGYRLMAKIAQVISERLHDTRIQLASLAPQMQR